MPKVTLNGIRQYSYAVTHLEQLKREYSHVVIYFKQPKSVCLANR